MFIKHVTHPIYSSAQKSVSFMEGRFGGRDKTAGLNGGNVKEAGLNGGNVKAAGLNGGSDRTGEGAAGAKPQSTVVQEYALATHSNMAPPRA